MALCIQLTTEKLNEIRTVNPRLVSYNIEMTEVTGGTFWKAYTPEQVAGTEKFPILSDLKELAKLLQWYDPIDATNPRLRKLAKAFGSAWVRVSGSWATQTYYDFEDTGVTPEGYQARMSRQQWINILDFADAVGAKVLISLANCAGLHHTDEPWNPSEAEKIFNLSIEHGHPIDAVEFTNEPNMMEAAGFPKGYKPEHFRRDQDLFHKWLRKNHPNTLAVGPSATGGGVVKTGPQHKGGADDADVIPSCSNEELMDGCTEKLDVFSYHYYNGVSERLESVMPSMHWDADEATTEEFLALAGMAARAYAPYRDKYCPGGQMWVTESGDAAGGGDTWGSTYLDVLRTLNELGEFCTITDGVIFHNTLASSDYGWLQHTTFEPRPNYFAVLLWNTLMGTTVYDSNIPVQEGAHVYCHSRKDGKDGCVYLVINNSLTDATTVELPKNAVRYTLEGRDGMRSRVMTLNGKNLVLGENDELPCLCGESVPAGSVELAPGSCTFFVL